MNSSVIKLIQSGVVVIALLFLSACGDSTKTDEQYVVDAQELYQKKDLEAAVIELKNALQQNGDNAEARALLGRIYIILGQGEAAEKELDRAYELGVAFRDVAIPLGDALLYQGKAKELIEEFKFGEYDSADLKAIKTVLIGEAYYQLKSFDGAANYFANALKSDVVKARAIAGQALLALSKGELLEALKLVKKSLDVDGGNAKNWLLLADIRRAQGSSEKAIEAYKRTAELAYSKQDYLYQAAMRQVINEYLKENKTQLAEEALAALKSSFYKQQFPGDPQLSHLRAVLAFQQKKYEVAAELANNVLSIERNHLGATLLLGTVAAIEGKYEQAEVSLKRFLQLVPKNIQARKLLAFVQLKNKQQGAAIETLGPLVGESQKPDVETLTLIARASLRVGEAKQSSMFLRQALEQSPADNEIRMALARSLILQRHFGQALEELSDVEGSQDALLNARLLIAKAHIAANDYASALRVLDQLRQELPGNPLLVSLSGTVALLMGDTERATVSFKQALALDSGYAPALRSLAVLAASRGDYETAQLHYQDALIASPNNVYIYLDYSGLLFEMGELDEAEVLLKKAQELGSNSSASAVQLARMYLRQGDASRALSELRALNEQDTNAEVTTEIANAQMMLGQYQSALANYLQAAENTSMPAVADYLVATAHIALKNSSEAKQFLVSSLEAAQSFTPALIALAEIMMQEKNYSKASVLIGQLSQVDPDNQALPLLEAELALHEKRPQQAVALYEAFYQKSANIYVLQRLVQAYWMLGEQEKALTVLLEANNKYPNVAQVAYLLAMAYAADGQELKAIETYKSVISLNEGHVFALNNLAWLLKDRDAKAALSYAKKAKELAPDDLSVMDTLKEIEKRLN